ncbi:hypothetical protein ACSW9O_16155 (plasmid) [Clostridium perfringens]
MGSKIKVGGNLAVPAFISQYDIVLFYSEDDNESIDTCRIRL